MPARRDLAATETDRLEPAILHPSGLTRVERWKPGASGETVSVSAIRSFLITYAD